MTRINGMVSSFQRFNHIGLSNFGNIIHNMRRSGDSVPLVYTADSRCDEHNYDYEIPASNTKDYNKPLSYQETLIHEHSYVPVTDTKRKYVVRCITCSIYFCELCGKALDNPLNHFC